MNKKLVLALMLVACLAACKKKDDGGPAPSPGAATNSQSAASDSSAATAADVSAAPAAAKTATPNAAPAKASETSNSETPLKMTAPDLAYSYDYNVQAPAKDVPHLVREHESACAIAGPTVCQVVGATTKSEGQDDVTGRLEIRATSDWIARFRDRVEQDVKSYGGKIKAAETGTDDLSRSLVDTQAAIRAKTELRDRLEGLLKHHKGKLDDLVELESQVSEVQGQIDAANSELAVMKTRVQTQKLVIEYSSMTALGPDSPMHPLAEASRGFTHNFALAASVIVYLVSILLPFGLVGGAIAWVVVSRRRKSLVPPPAANGPMV